MNLEKAIEILEQEAHLAKRQPETGISDALSLGIEALKRIIKERPLCFALRHPKLPSEAKD